MTEETTIESKPTPPLVLYHGNCLDGFTAAWACRRVHPDWEFVEAFYGDAPPDVTGRDVYLLDFSYKRPVLEEMLTKALRITVLDHHKTAQDDLHDLLVSGRVYGKFDMSKSGARLAWEWFTPREDVTAMVLAVEDRDLWRKKLPYTEEICALLYSYDFDFWKWSQTAIALGCEDYFDSKPSEEDLQIRDRLIAEGRAILRQRAKTVEQLVKLLTRRITVAGHDVPAVNAPFMYASDVGNAIAKGELFGVVYWHQGAHVHYSLRSAKSEPQALDVGAIAAQFGGGGHVNAAGGRSTDTLDQTVQRFIQALKENSSQLQ